MRCISFGYEGDQARGYISKRRGRFIWQIVGDFGLVCNGIEDTEEAAETACKAAQSLRENNRQEAVDFVMGKLFP